MWKISTYPETTGKVTVGLLIDHTQFRIAFCPVFSTNKFFLLRSSLPHNLEKTTDIENRDIDEGTLTSVNMPPQDLQNFPNGSLTSDCLPIACCYSKKPGY